MKNIGDIFEDEVTFTRQQVLKFAELTGDFNPIHIDEEFAAASKYGRIIVHGALAGCAFSKILSVSFPGPGTIVMHRESTFIRPVFIDEPYKMLLKISSIDFETQTAVMKCYLKNKEGKNCILMVNKLKNEEVFVK